MEYDESQLWRAIVTIIPNISSCCDRVGTGLSDEERRKVADHLRPQFLDADAKRTNAPKCYTVTGASKERPDVWIKDPFQSVVLQVNYLCLQPKGTVHSRITWAVLQAVQAEFLSLSSV